MSLHKLKTLLKSYIKREITSIDLVSSFIRRVFISNQLRYNFYVKKWFLYDNLNDREVSLILLVGKYSALWDVVFRRVYEYSEGSDVIVVNAGGFSKEKALKLSKDYGFSYFESFPNNYVSAQNFVIGNVVRSKFIIKMDDDVFLTKSTIKNMMNAYRRLVDEGHDVGFIAPVLNVNNVSYYHFLKTLNLIDDYIKLFGKPLITQNWSKQPVWYNPHTSQWIWEKSLPLNEISDIFERVNNSIIEIIPVRFSIQCILFKRSFLLSKYGFLSPFPKLQSATPKKTGKLGEWKILPIPIGDEDFINFIVDNLKYGRYLVLDSFAGHLAYFPQTEHMLRWFEKNRKRFVEDM